MKILFLNNFYYIRGGSERVMFEEMRMLKEAGHQVAVFTRAYRLNQPSPHERFFPPEIQRDRYTYSLEGLITLKEIFYSSSARNGLRRMVNEFRPDIVHAHNIYGGLSTAVLDELKELKLPVLMTLHDLKLICPSYLMVNQGKVCERCRGRRFYQAVLTRCHKNSLLASAVYATESYYSHLFRKYEGIKLFICPSRFLLHKHRDFGFDDGKMVHIPNPVRLNGCSLVHHPGKHLLYFGRISREKGLRTLISAYRQANTAMPLHIAGEGPDRQSLESLVREERIDGVTFTGYLDAVSLGLSLKSARAVIVPSECYENAPMAILESFGYGKPVIGSRIGGIPELIEDGVNGFLFEPGDVGDLRNALNAFLSLPDGRVHEMGLAARNKVEREHSADLHYRLLLSAYRSALQNTSARPIGKQPPDDVKGGSKPESSE